MIIKKENKKMDNKLYLISADDCGYLAITNTYESAINYLLKHNYIYNDYDYYDSVTDENIPLKKYALSLGYRNLQHFLLCNEDKFNDIFIDQFSIEWFKQSDANTWI